MQRKRPEKTGEKQALVAPAEPGRIAIAPAATDRQTAFRALLIGNESFFPKSPGVDDNARAFMTGFRQQREPVIGQFRATALFSQL